MPSCSFTAGGGAAHARLVLGVLGRAYATRAGCIRAPLIHAASAVLGHGHDDRCHALLSVLQRHDWIALERLVLDFRAGHPGTPARDALQSILLDLIAGRRPVVARLRQAV